MIAIKIRKSSRNKQTQNIDLKPFVCPNCHYIIVLDTKFNESIVIPCPNCEQKNIFKKSIEKPEKKYEKSNKIKNWLSQISFNTMIIGVIIILTSITLLLFIKNPLTTEISFTLILIGVLFQFFIIKKEQNISTKVTLLIIIYIIFLFFIIEKDIDLFLSLIFLGVLITKIMIDAFIPKSFKIRMNLFLSIFFIIFLISIIKRIISVINI